MQSPSGVGMTAVGVAGARAVESARADRLFDDPWAEDFLRAARRGGSWSHERGGWSALLAWTVVRTRFIDQCVLDAVRAGCGQVVLLGAGLDTRALRLPLPAGTSVFELDTDEVLDFKDAVLTRARHRRLSQAKRLVVGTDLRQAWTEAVLAAGFDATLPSIWVIEGLLQYLSEDQNNDLLHRVASLSSAASRLSGTVTAPGARNDPLGIAGVGQADDARNPLRPSALRKMWKSDGPADPVAWLAGYGWVARAIDAAEFATTLPRTDLVGDSDADTGDIGPRAQPMLTSGPARTLLTAHKQ